MNAHADDARSCYERTLADHPNLVGRLYMHWTVGGDGAMRNVTVEQDALHSDAVATCLTALIAKWRFTPAPGDPVEVSFPFVFQSTPSLRGVARGCALCRLLHMATNLAIDDSLLNEALRIGGRQTKKDTVTEALEEYVQRRKQERILDLFGKVAFDPKYDYKRQRRRT